jgi:uncharacterized membrane protein
VEVGPVTSRPGIRLVDAWSCVVLLAVLWGYLAFGRTSLPGEIVAVPLVFLVPGGLLVMMLPSRPKDGFFQFALAVGLSIAMCIAVGLLLNFLPTGIDHRTWTCALGMVSMTEAVVVASLESRAVMTRSSSPSMPIRTSFKSRVVVTVAVVAILSGAIASVAWERLNAEAANSQERFAEVWINPVSGQAAVVGVRSNISGSNGFRLSISAAGHPIKDYAFTLEGQETWSQRIPIAPDSKGQVLISLFNGSSSQPSESVWYDPSSGA